MVNVEHIVIGVLIAFIIIAIIFTIIARQELANCESKQSSKCYALKCVNPTTDPLNICGFFAYRKDSEGNILCAV